MVKVLPKHWGSPCVRFRSSIDSIHNISFNNFTRSPGKGDLVSDTGIHHPSFVPQMKRALLITIGSLSTLLAIIGIFIPILPTTPFLLLAAASYAKSSQRLYQLMIRNRLFGEYIRKYREGEGVPLAIKIITLLFLWISLGTTIICFYMADSKKFGLLLIFVGVCVTIHVLHIRTTRHR